MNIKARKGSKNIMNLRDLRFSGSKYEDCNLQ
jgi:hypothetical protein